MLTTSKITKTIGEIRQAGTIEIGSTRATHIGNGEVLLSSYCGFFGAWLDGCIVGANTPDDVVITFNTEVL